MRIPHLGRLLGALAVGLLSAIPASAQLYGVSSATPGAVYTIDASTGAATHVVDITGINFTSLVGAEFMNGTLYATDVLSDGWHFGSIDLSTGVFTAINSQDGSANWHGLAANEAAGLFYTVDINDGNKLKSVTTGGVVTTIGTGAGTDGRGMAFDSLNGVLYAVGGGNSGSGLYSIDVTTGLASFIGGIDFVGNMPGLAYDAANDTLYLNDGVDHNLYTVDRVTGAASLIGSNGVDAFIDGLAWKGAAREVPEPGTLAMLAGAGVVGLGIIRRRK